MKGARCGTQREACCPAPPAYCYMPCPLPPAPAAGIKRKCFLFSLFFLGRGDSGYRTPPLSPEVREFWIVAFPFFWGKTPDWWVRRVWTVLKVQVKENKPRASPLSWPTPGNNAKAVSHPKKAAVCSQCLSLGHDTGAPSVPVTVTGTYFQCVL